MLPTIGRLRKRETEVSGEIFRRRQKTRDLQREEMGGSNTPHMEGRRLHGGELQAGGSREMSPRSTSLGTSPHT